IALACLETVVHLAVGDLPLNRYLVSIEIPDDVWEVAAILPKDHAGWDAIPAGITSLDAGNQWMAAMISTLLFVPSVIVPEENNILINPAHPEAARIKAKKLRRWTYDARLR
ncbi:MAG: RES family NAD+ phosphorylase, partial [Nitrosospira sp.]|nr:RES family NAD+ phosphorylase [Nitrosospira sp.]